MSGPEVVVAGVSCVDFVTTSATLAPGVMNPAEIRVSVGGIGNAVTALSGLGVSCGVSTRVGRDMFGDHLKRRWAEQGADLAGVVTDPQRPTGLSMVLNHGGERTPFYAPGAVSAFARADIPPSYVRSAKVFLVFFAGALPALDGPPLAALVRDCHAAGGAVILDLSDKTGADYSPVPACLPYVNLVVNAVEAERMTGLRDPAAAAGHLCHTAGGSLQNRCVAVTTGGGAAFACERDGRVAVRTVESPFHGRPVNDVVGAGDAFRAGLAWFIARHHDAWREGRLDWTGAFRHACAVSYLFLSRTTDDRPCTPSAVENILSGATRTPTQPDTVR